MRLYGWPPLGFLLCPPLPRGWEAAEGRRTRILHVALLSGGGQRPFTKNALERDRDGGGLAYGHLPLHRRPEMRCHVLPFAVWRETGDGHFHLSATQTHRV
eukprot:3759516-Pleurochrysis_carterae.AAC.1